ncbi:MAG: hypothetical protein IJ829_04095 [Kiritimatiellae bacterium]|nr:hypothetical protein [Kiritimatiellia bacterium]
MKRTAFAVAVLGAALAANAAYDYYWFGTAGDDLWTTAANWSSSPDEYVAVANGYPRSTTFNVHVDTSVAPGHHVTIRIPKLASNGASCNAFELFDSTGAGTLTLVGEPDEEAGRPYVPLGLNKTFTWTETGHPMRLEFLNLNLANGTLSVVENECAGCGVLVSNCVSTSTSNSYYLKLPGQHGGSMTVIDSEITTQILNNSAAGSDVAGYVLAVTNSTIKISNGASVGGPGTVVDFVGSTIRLGSYAPAFGAGSIAATNDHANMKVAFKDTTIDFNKKFVLVMSAGGTLLFDNVVQGGECRGVELAGLATTELKNTSLRFYDTTGNGYRGISGDLILDNSEWVGTNASQNVALNGPLRVEFRGAAPRFGGRQFAGNYPVTFDFLLPKGGYAYPPVNRMDNAAAGQIFPSGAVGGSINVLPESPALKVVGETIYPLIYVKDSKSSKPVCNLTNLPLTTLPNDKSKFLMTADYTWSYEDVNGKAESEWTEVATGYNGNQTAAGVAVKVVVRALGLKIVVR